jgi:FAD/FMN-containing dehydrogenase
MEFDQIFSGISYLSPEDDGYESYLEDVVMKGTPLAIFRPQSREELVEIIKRCYSSKTPFTPCGNQSSVTGASVCSEGVLISLSKLTQILDLESLPNGCARVQVQPGIILSEFQEEMERRGYFYPPDPTSREEACLGATVATNASGEDSYHYGSTRNYVLGLEVLTSDGKLQFLKRQGDPLRLPRHKNRAGYILEGEPLDLFIGSEGTLGILTELSLLVLPKPDPVVSILLFFRSESEALDFTIRADQCRDSLNLRCLEYLDQNATDIAREKSGRFHLPVSCSTLYLKTESATDEVFESVFIELEDLYVKVTQKASDFELALVAQDRGELQELRKIRHHVPATLNEWAKARQATGGGKVGSDWWVPLEHLKTQFSFARKLLSQFTGPCVTFGHLGNGHPHINLLPSTDSEKKLAKELTRKCMENAVRLGGGACGEHGLGKIKTWALPLQWDENTIDKMLALKHEWDPPLLAAPGNIFGNLLK